MLSDVNIRIEDGLLGLTADTGTGVHVKIGPSPYADDRDPFITITGSMTAAQIKDALGLCPLADAVMDSVENGSDLIYCLPVDQDFSSNAPEVYASDRNTGTGSATLSGEPYNAFSIVVSFTGKGGRNSALLRYSIDSGITFSEVMTLPLDGQVRIGKTGLTVTFSEGTDADADKSSFEVGDVYAIQTEAPTISNEKVLEALETLRYLKKEFEIVHIVGEADKALWAAVSAEQKRLEEIYHKPLLFVLEACKPAILRPMSLRNEDYFSGLENDLQTIINPNMQIVAARATYNRMDGSTAEVNVAGIITGLYSRAAVYQSIGEVRNFAISEGKLTELLPEDIEKRTEELDKNRCLTLRQYDGLDGFFVASTPVLSTPTSDYRYAEDVRVRNKLIRLTYKAAIYYLQTDIDPTKQQSELDKIGKFIAAGGEKMVRDGEIASCTITVPQGQDVLSTGKLNLQLRYVPRGHVREITINMGIENPLTMREIYDNAEE